MSQTSNLIRRGERRSQSIRPATLEYPVAGGSVKVPCTLGNLDFFQVLMGEAGFQGRQHLYVKILRSDIPPSNIAISDVFSKGLPVTITNQDEESPGFGEEFKLLVADNNATQPQLLSLHLEKELA